MFLILPLVLLACGGAAGWLTWRIETKAVNRRHLRRPDMPAGMTRRTFERAERRRRKLSRLGKTMFFALLGAGAGFLFLMLLPRR